MASRVKSNKRRKADSSESHDTETAEHQPSTSAGAIKCLDDVGVPIGPKTTRTRLLDLLNKHVTRKRVRTGDHPKPTRRSKSAREQIQHNITLPPNALAFGAQGTSTAIETETSPAIKTQISPAIEVQETGVGDGGRGSEVQEPTEDFSQFQDSQLVQLLWMVGVNTEALDRTVLIRQCEAYHELIIIPEDFFDVALKANSSGAFKSTPFTLDIPYDSSRLSTSMGDVHIQPAKTTQPSFSTGFGSSGSLAPAGSNEVPEKGLTHKTKKKIRASSTASSKGGVGLPQQDHISKSQKPGRRTRNSMARTDLGTDSSTGAPDGALNQASSRRSKSACSSKDNISQESHLPSNLPPEEPIENLSSALTAAQKGKNVVQRGVSSVDSDDNSAREEVSSLGIITPTHDSLESTRRKAFGSLTKGSGLIMPFQSASQASTSASPFLPSLEHRRLSYPRPNPTHLSSSKSTSQKDQSESEWELESQVDVRSEAPCNISSNRKNSQNHDQDPDISMPKKNASRFEDPRDAPITTPPDANSNATEANETLDDDIGAQDWTMAQLQRRVIEDSRLIRRLENECRELNTKVDSLTHDVKYLSKIIGGFKMEQGGGRRKTRGGRMAVPHRYTLGNGTR